MEEFDPMLAIVKVKLIGEKNRRWLELAGFYIGTFFRRRFPISRLIAVVARFIPPHLVDYARVRDCNAAVLSENLVTVSMIAMMMRIKGEPNWLFRDGADFADH